MSDTEKRVVELEFDNKQFEKNVDKSMSTIDKLDKKLSMDGVTDGVKKVTKSFKKMDAVAFTVIQRLTNRVIDLGVQLVKSLSVDNIFTGWLKYGDKTTSFATIFAQEIKIAGKTMDNEAKKIEVINEQLEKLNWFTDETSYNFTDMVDNIGKFTAAGVDLDQAVEAMMGIANWAALSGQNATKASSAMYQLAQTLGKGSVQLIDYKSIQNASMDTQEFRQTVLDTAVELKQLTKEGEKYITKTGKSFTKNQFPEELSEKWFSSEVLTKSLAKYSAAVDKIYEIAQETGLTASEVISRYGKELDQFGVKAFRASQEARTFRDTINSVKDAVSTGWMNTAENIFGSYTKSKELWSELANELYNVFAESGNFRNEVLKLWNTLEGRNDLFKKGGENQGAFWNMYDAIIAIKQAIKSAWRSLFPITEFQAENDQVKDLSKKLKEITGKFRDWSARLKEAVDSGGKLYNVMRAAFSVVKVGVLTVQGALYVINPIWTSIKQMFNYLTTRVSLVGKNLNKVEPVLNSIRNAVEKVHDSVENIVEAIDPVGFLDKVFVGISDITRVIKDYHPIEKLSNFFTKFVDSLKENGTNAENFKRIWSGLTSILSMSFKLIKTIGSFLAKILAPVLEVLVNLLAKIVSIVSGLLSHILAAVGDFFTFLNNVVSGKGGDVNKKVNEYFSTLTTNLSKLKPVLSSVTSIFKNLFTIVKAIPKALNDISVKLTGNTIVGNIVSLTNTIGDTLKKVTGSIASLFKGASDDIETNANEELDNININSGAKNAKNSGLVQKINYSLLGVSSPKEAVKALNTTKSLLESFKDLLTGIVEFLNGIVSVLSSLVSFIGRIFSEIGKLLQSIGTAFKTFFESLDWSSLGNVLGFVLATSMLVIGAVFLMNMVYAIKSWIAPLKYLTESLADLADGLRLSMIINGIAYLIRQISFMLLSFSASIAILIGIMKSDVNNNFDKAITTIGIFLGILAAFIVVLIVLSKKLSGFADTETDTERNFLKVHKTTKSSSSTMSQTLRSISKMISVLTTGLLKIAIALKLMSGIDTASLVASSIVIGVFTTLMGAIIIYLTKASKQAESFSADPKAFSKTTSSIIKFALSMRLLTGGIVSLSKIADAGKMWSAIGGVTAILAALTAFMFILQTKFPKLDKVDVNYKAVSNMIFKFSLSLLVIVGALKIFSSISEKTIDWVTGFFIAASVFLLIAAALKVLAKGSSTVSSVGALVTVESKKLPATASSIFAAAARILAIGIAFSSMAVSLLFVAGAIASLTYLDWSQAWKGLLAVLGFLGLFTGMTLLIAKKSQVLNAGQKVAARNLLAVSVDVIAMSAAMLLLTASIAILSSLNWNQAWKACLVVGIYLTLISAATVLIATLAKGIDREAKTLATTFLSLSVLFISFSTSLLLLTASIAILSNYEWPQVGVALTTISIFLVALTAMVLIVNRYSTRAIKDGMSAWKNVLSLSVLLASFSLALIGISTSILLLSSLDWPNAGIGLVAFSIFLVALIVALRILSKQGSSAIEVITSTSSGLSDMSQRILSLSVLLASVSISLLILAASMKMFTAVDFTTLGKAGLVLLGLLAMLTGLILILRTVGKNKLTTKPIIAIAGSILGVAAAFTLVAFSIKTLQTSMKAVNDSSNAFINNSFVAKNSGMGSAASEESKSGLSGVLGSVLMISGIVAVLTVTLIVLQKLVKKASNTAGSVKSALIQLGSTLVMFAAVIGSMFIFIKELSTFADLDWDQIGKMAAGMAIISGMIFAIVGALALLKMANIDSKTLISFAASLGITVVALLGFIGALYLLEGVTWKALGMGALILAGALAILVIAGYAMKPVISVISQFALALFLISMAFMLTATAMGALSEALGPFMESFNENFDTISEAIKNLVTLLVVALLDALGTILDKSTEIMPKIGDFLIELFNELFRVLDSVGPKLGETLTHIFQILAENAGPLWDSIFKILSSLLKTLKAYVPTIVADLVDIFILICNTLGKYVKQICDALFDLLIKIVDYVFGPAGQAFLLHIISTILTFIGNILSYLVNYVIQFAGLVAKLILILISAALQLALASLGTIGAYLIAFFGGLIWLCVEIVKGLAEVIYIALKNIFVIIIETLGKVLREIGPLLVAAGRYLMAQLAYGFLDAIESSFIGDLLKFFGVSFDGAKGYLDKVSKDMSAKMEGIAGDMGDTIKQASKRIMNTTGTIVNTMQEITEDGLKIISSTVDSSAENIGSAMADFGKNMTSSLVDGLEEETKKAAERTNESGEYLAEAEIEGFKKEAQIHSPSRVMMQMGEYLADGLAIGVEDNKDVAVDAMTDVVNKTVDVVDQMVNEGVGDDSLTIRPVLDLDNVTEGVNDISKMMTSINGGSISTELAGKTSKEIRRNKEESDRIKSANQNGQSVVNNEGDTYNATFNVTTNDPEDFADRLDKILQKKRLQFKIAKGV